MITEAGLRLQLGTDELSLLPRVQILGWHYQPRLGLFRIAGYSIFTERQTGPVGNVAVISLKLISDLLELIGSWSTEAVEVDKVAHWPVRLCPVSQHH